MSHQPRQPSRPSQPRNLTTAPGKAPCAPSTTAAAQPVQLSDERITQLSDRAQHGDTAALDELRQAMTTDPWLERQLSDFAFHTRQNLARFSISEQNLLVREVLDRHLAALRKELETSVHTPLERLLVERILTCWVAVHLAELAAAGSLPPGDSRDHRDERLHRAHHRYLAAIQALARVSHLLAPTIAQINIAAPGAQQLNVATSTPTSASAPLLKQTPLTPTSPEPA